MAMAWSRKGVLVSGMVLALSSLAAGCSEVGRLGAAFDDFSFSHFGSTLYSRPSTLTLKEIHLSSSSPPGDDVIVEGRVERVSDHGTYLVLTDEAARLLVVLTELDPTAWERQSVSGQMVRIKGTVESGKRGLPVLKAQALSRVVDGKA